MSSNDNSSPSKRRKLDLVMKAHFNVLRNNFNRQLKTTEELRQRNKEQGTSSCLKGPKPCLFQAYNNTITGLIITLYHLDFFRVST